MLSGWRNITKKQCWADFSQGLTCKSDRYFYPLVQRFWWGVIAVVVLLERDNISKNAPNELVFHFNPPRNMGRGEIKKEFMFFGFNWGGEHKKPEECSQRRLLINTYPYPFCLCVWYLRD